MTSCTKLKVPGTQCISEMSASFIVCNNINNWQLGLTNKTRFLKGCLKVSFLLNLSYSDFCMPEFTVMSTNRCDLVSMQNIQTTNDSIACCWFSIWINAIRLLLLKLTTYSVCLVKYNTHSPCKVTTLCIKNRHPFCFCYNFVSRDQILVFFGSLVAKKICNWLLLTYLKVIAGALS